MVERKTSLRVLYTINSSPQYILARSQTRVPVELIPYVDDSATAASPDASTSPPLYANVLLKTCLDTICRSSPELTQDSNRDFSLYVLDPLESNSAPAPVNISNTNTDSSSSNTNAASAEQPRGVAVGLGLMSWALTGDDSDFTTVVGTLVKQANGQEALEVIFALRETMAMKRPAWSIHPSSSQPCSSQESGAGSSGPSQGDVKPSLSQPPVYQHPVHSSSSMKTRSSTTDLTRETLASIQLRTKAKVKPPKPVRQSTIPVTESDKFLNAATYIGPLKKKGRPKSTAADAKANVPINAVASGSGTSSQPKDIIVIDGSDSEGTLPTPTTANFSKSTKTASAKSISRKRSVQPAPSPFTTVPLVTGQPDPRIVEPPVQVKVEPQEGPTILDLLAFLSATSSTEPNAQNAAILTALSNIDSSAGSGKQPEESRPNPNLVSALKQLLSVCATSPVPPTPEATTPEIAKQLHHSSSHSQEVIAIDKENVNPVVHRKRHEDGKGAKSMDTTLLSISSSPGTSQTSTQQQQHNLSRSSRSNENISQRSSLKDSSFGSGTEKVARKRTLSDFMDEREKGKSKGKGKERERVERRDGHRHGQQRTQKVPVVDSLRHYPRILASNQPRAEQPANYYRVPLESMTSPARPRPDFDEYPEDEKKEDYSIAESSTSFRQSRTPSPPPPRVSASSPVRGPYNEARRKYIVPEWARTSTSTQPRLSEEVQRALEEVEEKKRQERSAARKRLPSVQAKLKAKNVLGSSASNSNQARPLAPALPPHPPKHDAFRGPIAVNDRPMFAASNINFPFISSSRPSSPPPQQLNVIPKTPKTPIRQRSGLQATPGQQNESLFTPMGGGSLFGSAFSARTPLPPSILTSPLGNRKKAKLSPMRSALTGKGIEFGKWDNSSSSAPNSSDSKDMDDDDKSLKRALDLELEDALEDLDCPLSSLPIASSDMDADSSSYTASGGPDTEVEVETIDANPPVKQHWAGLPPSSPPAPSSPMLLPESGDQSDEEMDELPIATSDSETDTDMNACDTDTPSPAVFSPLCDDDSSTSELSFFALPDYTADSEHVSSSDLFEQFTNLNNHSDGFTGMGDINLDPGMEDIFQNGLNGIDFTEFWATFKPLVDDNTLNLQDQNAGSYYYSEGQDDPLVSFSEIDHAKLADDMQTLLSGCLM